MKFGSLMKGTVNSISIAKFTAGWAVVRYELHRDGADVVCGCFPTIEQAKEAGKQLLTDEVDRLSEKIATEDGPPWKE